MIINESKYSDDEKKKIYDLWCKYQKDHKYPTPEGGVKGYTDSMYDTWKSVLIKNNYLKESVDDWSGYFVIFTYDGDALSPYETTVIVKATSEKDAINKAERDIKKDPAFLDRNPHNFRIDRSRSNGKINSYNVYKNKFKNSNFKVIAEKLSTKSMDVDKDPRNYQGTKYIRLYGTDEASKGRLDNSGNWRSLEKIIGYPVESSGFYGEVNVKIGNEDPKAAVTKIKKALNSNLNEAAKDAIVLNKNSKTTVASQIALNITGEWDAIDGYMKLIEFFKKYNDQDAIDQIEEIIGDEKNHAEKLRGILLRYDGNIPTAKD